MPRIRNLRTTIRPLSQSCLTSRVSAAKFVIFYGIGFARKSVRLELGTAATTIVRSLSTARTELLSCLANLNQANA
jgi:hypothetical protein